MRLPECQEHHFECIFSSVSVEPIWTKFKSVTLILTELAEDPEVTDLQRNFHFSMKFVVFTSVWCRTFLKDIVRHYTKSFLAASAILLLFMSPSKINTNTRINIEYTHTHIEILTSIKFYL